MTHLSISEILENPLSAIEAVPPSEREVFVHHVFNCFSRELDLREFDRWESMARGILLLVMPSSRDPELVFRAASLLYTIARGVKSSLWFSKAVGLIEEFPSNERSASLHSLMLTCLYEQGLLEKNPSILNKVIILGLEEHGDSIGAKWIIGKTWALLGRLSGEAGDFNKGLTILSSLRSHISPSLKHAIDFDISLSLLDYGKASGDLKRLEQALALLEPLASHFSLHEKEERSNTLKAWRLLVEGAIEIFKLEGSERSFERAKHLISEALLTLPEHKNFWLRAAELYLYHSIFRESLFSSESALEKCSVEGVRFEEQEGVISLSCSSLALMGLYSGNPIMIYKAKQQIEKVLIQSYCEKIALAYQIILWADAAISKDPLKIQESETLLEQREGCLLSYLMLYRLKETRGDLEEVKAILRKVIALYPTHTLFRLYMGKVLHKSRVYLTHDEEHRSVLEEAAKHFQKALDHGGGYEPMICLGTTYDQLGLHYKEEIYFEQSLSCFETAFKLEAPDVESLFLFARALIHRGDLFHLQSSLTRGINVLRQLIELESGNAEFYLLLSYAWICRETREEAFDRTRLSMAYPWIVKAYKKGKGEAAYFLAVYHSLREEHRLALKYSLECIERKIIRNYQVFEDDPLMEAFSKSPWFSVGQQLSSHLN